MSSSVATVSTIGQHSNGRGNGRGRGRLRSANEGRGQGMRTQTTAFKRSTAEMNGNVFECYEEQTDRRQYAKTLEALESHAKKTLKFAKDLAPLFAETMTEPTLTLPDDPGANPSRAADMIYAEKVKILRKEGKHTTQQHGHVCNLFSSQICSFCL
jgi:hypothetical protein